MSTVVFLCLFVWMAESRHLVPSRCRTGSSIASLLQLMGTKISWTCIVFQACHTKSSLEVMVSLL